MRAELTEGEKRAERVRDHLRRCVEESRPFLDRSIPLGKPVFENAAAIRRYYERKLLRYGSYGQYAGLHETGAPQGGNRRTLQRNQGA